MKIDIDSYRHCKEMLVKEYRERGLHRAYELAVVSGINLIAMYHFLNEDFPSDELKKKIDELCLFYNVSIYLRK